MTDHHEATMLITALLFDQRPDRAADLGPLLHDRCRDAQVTPAAEASWTIAFHGTDGTAGPRLAVLLEQPQAVPEIVPSALGLPPHLQHVGETASWHIALWHNVQHHVPMAHHIAAHRSILHALLEHFSPVGVYSFHTQQLLDPDLARTTPELVFLAPRGFRVEGERTGVLFDTIGLDALGLPDLEVLADGDHPSAALEQLVDIALYQIDHGDTLNDNDTLDGDRPGRIWRAHRPRTATIEPLRPAIQLTSEYGRKP